MRSRSEQLVAVTRIARHVVAQPIWRLEILRRLFVIEFHFRDDEAVMPAAVDIDLHDAIFERDVVAYFLEPPAFGRGPERVELYWRQLHFAFLADVADAALVSERVTLVRFSQPHLKAVVETDKIPLRNLRVRKSSQLFRQFADEKLPLDLAIRFCRLTHDRFIRA